MSAMSGAPVARTMRRVSLLIHALHPRKAAALTAIRHASTLTNTNPLPDPLEQQQAFWSDPKNEREVFVYPIGMGARHVVLNRPTALNALNLPMIEQLTNIVKAADKDSDVALVMITGAGTKAFCAGGDIRALYNAGLARKAQSNRTGANDLTKQFFRKEYALNFQMSITRVPLVPVLNGITMGGGYGISGHCRYRCATPTSMFAMPETSIGFFPDVGASYLLPRLHHTMLGTYLALTGARLTGYDLVHAGIATHYSTHNDWPSQLELAFNTTGNTYQQAEDAIENIGWRMSELELQPEPVFSLAPEQLNFIRETFSLESVELVMEKLQSVAAQSSSSLASFAADTVKLLSKSSPLSLKVTHELMRRGAKMSLQECLAMEYRLTQRFIEGDDFYIGVNSAVISKDRNPQWKHRKLKAVSDQMVEEFFAPLQDQEELQLTFPTYKQPQWYI